METEKINALLVGQGIAVSAFCANTKASDYFVKATFSFADGRSWYAVVPYVYRRSGLCLRTEREVADYLVSIKPHFTAKAMARWKKREWAKWLMVRHEAKNPEKLVTIDFFKTLLSFREEDKNLPANPNAQRRLQDLKDQGYTISIYPTGGRHWGKMLLPLPLNEATGYETFTPQFKARVVRLLRGINAYEAKATARKSLIPDHKFSEVRWDKDTRGENPMSMSDEEIIAKFQLLDNQRNLQKREICRNCYQTGERGSLYGIDFYSAGGKKWDNDIPTKGKAAEAGCKGCPWYDIEAWRKAVNTLLKMK